VRIRKKARKGKLKGVRKSKREICRKSEREGKHKKTRKGTSIKRIPKSAITWVNITTSSINWNSFMSAHK